MLDFYAALSKHFQHMLTSRYLLWIAVFDCVLFHQNWHHPQSLAVQTQNGDGSYAAPCMPVAQQLVQLQTMFCLQTCMYV